MTASHEGRLSVALVDVNEGHEGDFLAIAREFSMVLARKEYGRADIVRDEASSMRFYAVRHWASASSGTWNGSSDGQPRFCLVSLTSSTPKGSPCALAVS